MSIANEVEPPSPNPFTGTCCSLPGVWPVWQPRMPCTSAKRCSTPCVLCWYLKALEATLHAQPLWAEHGRPQPQKVWEALAATGLDIELARRDMERPEIAARLQQDAADIVALKVRQTPAFFINGKPLRNFSLDGLGFQLSEEIGTVK